MKVKAHVDLVVLASSQGFAPSCETRLNPTAKPPYIKAFHENAYHRVSRGPITDLQNVSPLDLLGNCTIILRQSGKASRWLGILIPYRLEGSSQFGLILRGLSRSTIYRTLTKYFVEIWWYTSDPFRSTTYCANAQRDKACSILPRFDTQLAFASW